MGYVPVSASALRKIALALVMGVALVAAACAPGKSGTGTVSADAMSAPLPAALSKLALTGSNLTIHVTVEDQATKKVKEGDLRSVVVNSGANTFTGKLPFTLAEGDYTFTLKFIYKDPTFGPTELATSAAIAATIVKGTNKDIDTSGATLTYANDDGDQLLNIDELDAGTDPKAATPIVALFANPSFVQYDSANPAAEASNIEAIFKAGKVFVRTFTGTTAADIKAATKGADGLVIPDLNSNNLAGALASDAMAAISGFAGRGGTVFLFAPEANNLNLVNVVFGLAFGAAGGTATDLDALAAAGTPLAGGPAGLANNDATVLVGVGTLATPTQAIYQDVAGNAAITNVPVGVGRLLVFGWDFNDAIPIGTQDGGWPEALLLATKYTMAHPKVALLANTKYVDYIPGNTDSEASNMESTLTDLGIPVTTFTDVSAAEVTKTLIGKDVLVLPEFENGDLTPDLNAAAQTVLAGYVAAGGTLIVNYSSDVNLLNTVFGFSLTTGGFVAANLQGPKADATPFARGPSTLAANDATSGITMTSLPLGARAVYNDGTNALLAVIPFGVGKIVYLGWDWFFDPADSASAKDAWFTALNSATRYAPGKVALYADPSYVDYFVDINSGSPNGSEATNLEEDLNRLLGIRTTPFSGLSAAEFTAGIGTRKVLLIPELEKGPLAADMDPAAKTVIKDFVSAGGTLVLFNPGTLQLNLLNQTFGFGVTEQFPGGDPTLQAAAAGTFFEGGPPSLPTPSATTGVSMGSLPAGSTAFYLNAASGVVVDIPVGAGHVLLLGWDWFDAVPLGGTNGGWIQVLKSSIAAALD
jgi:hypothetical protein